MKIRKKMSYHAQELRFQPLIGIMRWMVGIGVLPLSGLMILAPNVIGWG